MSYFKTTIGQIVGGVTGGMVIGFLCLFVLGAINPTPINLQVPPPANTDQLNARRVETYVNSSVVLDLVSILNEIHKEREGLRRKLANEQVLANEMIQAMADEIQRLNWILEENGLTPTPADEWDEEETVIIIPDFPTEEVEEWEMVPESENTTEV